jgi:cysteinyl-tRNA synthetase
MSMKYLGETFDIHTGGPDNKFPHHECEIAQAESVTGETFVRYWLHNGWLEIGGEKMSKSKGQLYTVPELTEMGYAGSDIRLYMLRQHYRAPLPFNIELLDEAKRQRARLDNFVNYELAERPEGEASAEIAAAVATAREDFRAALNDDLNSSAALAAIFELMSAVNRIGPSRGDAGLVTAFMRDEFDAVFAVLEQSEQVLDEEIEQLINERLEARKSRDFARADEIRDQLAAQGIELLDTPQGTRWKRK